MDMLTAVDALDDFLHEAKLVPLSDDVRVDPVELARLVEEIRVAIPPELERAGSTLMPTLVDRLDLLVRDAKPVPMSKNVRVDREGMYDVCDQVRAMLPEELAGARRLAPSGDDLPATTVSAEEAARSLPELLHKARFGGEAFRITLGGMPMADLRPPAEPDMHSE